MQEDIHDRRWYLATKVLTDNLTDEEQTEWKLQLEGDIQFKRDFELLEKNWDKLGQLPYDQINTAHDWQSVLAKVQAAAPAKNWFSVVPIWRYAAALAILVASWFVWKQFNGTTDTNFTTVVEAPHGARTAVKLPDSSTVWLNAGSKISFNQDFGIHNRDVVMEGEAFFDVKKSNVPFQIHTPAYEVSVLGTAFNIKAYKDDEVVSTTLVRGLLKISRMNAGKSEELLLHPNEKVVLHGTAKQWATSSMVLEKNIDAQADSEWKDGWLTVRGESLGELSKKIERLYNVKILFTDESLKSYRYNGRIQELSLEQVLNALALTSPVKYTVAEKKVTFSLDESTKSKYQSLQNP